MSVVNFFDLTCWKRMPMVICKAESSEYCYLEFALIRATLNDNVKRVR